VNFPSACDLVFTSYREIRRRALRLGPSVLNTA